MEINWPHVHLMINHIPVLGLPGAAALLAYGVIRKSDEVRAIGLAALVLVALAAIAVFFTGEAAEETVKKLPGVTESFIGRHEELADLSIVMVEATGVLALAGLVLQRRNGSVPKWFVALVLFTSIVTSGVVGLTANFGGEIRHTEIRGNK